MFPVLRPKVSYTPIRKLFSVGGNHEETPRKPQAMVWVIETHSAATPCPIRVFPTLDFASPVTT